MPAIGTGWTLVGPDLFLFRDACNVYAIRRGDEAVLIDAGTGAAALRLPEIGVRRVAHVLHTHHHRDQCQGSAALAEAGAALWAPEFEAELMGDPEGMWQGRRLLNSYSGRSDRFSPLVGLRLAGRLLDYTEWAWPGTGVRLRVLPAPGHTMGSCCLLWTPPGSGDPAIAFTGDLLYGPGKVWSLGTLQYDYNGVPGALLTIRSILALRAERPALLLPSHGEPMPDAAGALAATEGALRTWTRARDASVGGDMEGLTDALSRPLEAVTPHLLRDARSHSTNWVVLSGDGHAVWIDYGYPHPLFMTDNGGDPAGKRPLLHGIDQLRDEFGVRQVDAVLVTHHHDDHVAGIAALRRVTGAEVWVPEHFADVLQRPSAYKTQCLWYDPLPVDRRLPLGKAASWRGVDFTPYAQPGHTRHAACIAFSVDGRRCLAIGDQFVSNYIYGNQFALGDYPATVPLWRGLAPDLVLPGHGPAHEGPRFVEHFAAHAAAADLAHRLLLPLDDVDFGAGGQAAEVYPYQSVLPARGRGDIEVTARNPFDRPAEVRVRLTAPAEAGWSVEPAEAAGPAPARGSAALRFRLLAGDRPVRRGRFAVELSVDGRPFGQVEEGFVTVTAPAG